jgi:hypothetical protein
MVVSAFVFTMTPALCQSGQGSADNSATSTQSTERENDNDTNWGWIGLAGLLGLLGLRKKEHHHDETPGRVTR